MLLSKSNSFSVDQNNELILDRLKERVQVQQASEIQRRLEKFYCTKCCHATRDSSQPPPTSSENSRWHWYSSNRFNTSGLRPHKSYLSRPREGHPTYAATPVPTLSEGRGGGIFIPPCIARRASLTRLVLFSFLIWLFFIMWQHGLNGRRSMVERRTSRRLWNRGVLARLYMSPWYDKSN